MKLNDLVAFRIGRARRIVFGLLSCIHFAEGTCVIYRDGKRYVRDLNRVKSENAGRKALSVQMRRDRKRSGGGA